MRAYDTYRTSDTFGPHSRNARTRSRHTLNLSDLLSMNNARKLAIMLQKYTYPRIILPAASTRTRT